MDDRPATVMSVSTLVDAQGAIACYLTIDKAADCMHLIAGRDFPLWFVDQGEGNPPTVFYISLNGDAPDRDERFAEFDAMVDAAKFG